MALGFIADLSRRFRPRVDALLEQRRVRQAAIDAGEMPDFLPETREIREGGWQVAEIPADLRDRRVEITGPTDRKMVINALNSGANVFMADFEDANSPTWDNVIAGQRNVADAYRRQLSLDTGESVVTGADALFTFDDHHVLIDTPPELRRRGYARAVVAASLLDARAEGAERSILFTPVENIPAQRAYEALGYRHIGDYRLFLLRG